MNGRRIRWAVPAALVLGLALASLAVGATQDHGKGPPAWAKAKKAHAWKENRNTFRATLTGREEVPATHSKGKGHLTLTINADNTIAFELTYMGLANAATAAHVHFGQPLANGGVSFFLCGGSKPACPPGNTTTPATVTGTIVAGDVQAIASQLMPAGDLVAIVEEIRAGFTYANVHTAVSPAGEIRGQIHGKHHGKKWFWDD